MCHISNVTPNMDSMSKLKRYISSISHPLKGKDRVILSIALKAQMFSMYFTPKFVIEHYYIEFAFYSLVPMTKMRKLLDSRNRYKP